MKQYIIQSLLFLWQLPQNTLGFIISLICYNSTAKLFTFKDVNVMYSSKMTGGISLGKCIIINSKSEGNIPTLLHEYGHCKQSKYLGWLYLPLVGLPSILHLLIRDWFSLQHSYYSVYPENWADKLGGVERYETGKAYKYDTTALRYLIPKP